MNLFRSRGVDVFEAINKGDWQKVKDNVVQGKVREARQERTRGACGSFVVVFLLQPSPCMRKLACVGPCIWGLFDYIPSRRSTCMKSSGESM